MTFVFKNVGHVLHDFTISGKKTPPIEPGETAKLVVTFKKKGKYAYRWTVPGDAAAGMKGVFNSSLKPTAVNDRALHFSAAVRSTVRKAGCPFDPGIVLDL